MRIIALCDRYVKTLSHIKDLPLLFLRLVLAYGFYKPALAKMDDIPAIAGWFESMGIPFPTLNAYLATYTEFSGFILLALGLATRIITIPLMIVMLVAIKTVHWGDGFEAGDNGFEIPLYYLLMLFTLLVFGAGRVSMDYVIGRVVQK